MPKSARIQRIERSLVGRMMQRSENATAEIQPLVDLLDGAKRAVAKFSRTDGDGVHRIDHHRTRVAGINGSLPMTDNLRPLFGSIDRPPGGPTNLPAGERSILSTNLLESSRVIRAGTVMVPLPQAKAFDTGLPQPVLEEVPSEFVLIGAGEFTRVAADLDDDVDQRGDIYGGTGDGDGPADEGAPDSADLPSEAPVTAVPVSDLAVQRNGMQQYALRYEIKRSEMRRKGAQRVAAEIYTALSLGLARVADRSVLGAILAGNPEPFTAAAAAAQGLRYGELAGIVGTDGIGARAGMNGDLRVVENADDISGPPAELSGDMAETIVGAFDRSALAVGESIDIMAQRLNAHGKLTITCWVDLFPLVPDAGKFWRVNAA